MCIYAFGIQKHLPRALVYGTLQAQGLGLHVSFWTQMIQHLQVILHHANCDSPTQMMIAENMDLVQLYIGSEVNFLGTPL